MSKFKVGDRVRYNDRGRSFISPLPRGWEGEVVAINDDEIDVREWSGHEILKGMDEEEFDLFEMVEDKPIKYLVRHRSRGEIFVRELPDLKAVEKHIVRLQSSNDVERDSLVVYDVARAYPVLMHSVFSGLPKSE